MYLVSSLNKYTSDLNDFFKGENGLDTSKSKKDFFFLVIKLLNDNIKAEAEETAKSINRSCLTEIVFPDDYYVTVRNDGAVAFLIPPSEPFMRLTEQQMQALKITDDHQPLTFKIYTIVSPFKVDSPSIALRMFIGEMAFSTETESDTSLFFDYYQKKALRNNATLGLQIPPAYNPYYLEAHQEPNMHQDSNDGQPNNEQRNEQERGRNTPPPPYNAIEYSYIWDQTTKQFIPKQLTRANYHSPIQGDHTQRDFLMMSARYEDNRVHQQPIEIIRQVQPKQRKSFFARHCIIS